MLVPFNDHVRVEGLSADPGTGRTKISALPELTNHLGSVHGGALFIVGEVASARAFLGALRDTFGERMTQLSAITKAANINFLKMAKGEINAVGILATPMQTIVDAIETAGKTTAEVDVALTNAEAVTVATMRVTWHVRRLAD